MKANELMTGDWIRVSNVPTNLESKIGKCGRVVELEHYPNYSSIAIKFDSELDVYFCEKEDELEPIPLTQEILEKNGFKKEIGVKEVVFTYDDDDKNYRLVIHPKETNYCGIYTYIHIDVGCVGIEELPLEYVHQLQHALRLCGIEKEITL